MKYVVINQKGDIARAFGTYRTFKAADRDARSWSGWNSEVIILELEDSSTAPSPWDAEYYDRRERHP